MNLFAALEIERRVLLVDGGTGTGLFARGLMTGDSPELWNVDLPERIEDLHNEFIGAGSDIILTNSFGANRYRLQLHNAESRVQELNRAAAKIAKNAAGKAARKVWVAGSMGPTGEILAPVGSLAPCDAEAAFAEQAQALAEGGADLLWCETLSSEEEMRAAVAGAQTAGLPIVATMSFDTNGRTMMGLTPDAALAIAHELPLAGFGANCGIGAAQLVGTIMGFSRLTKPSDILVAKGNCGIPEYRDGHIHYSGTPEIMAQYAIFARDAGAMLIGGCCGTRGEHLVAMRRALDDTPPGPPPEIETVERALGSITTPTQAAENKARDRASRRRRRGWSGGAMNSTIKTLSECYTSVVHDVMARMGLKNFTLPHTLLPLSTGDRVCGPAFTVEGRIDDIADPHQTLLAWTGLLSKAPPGHVWVCQPNDPQTALMGELSAETLKLKGLLGCVIDGGIRDVQASRALGLPIWHRFKTPRDIVGRWLPHRTQQPVTIGEVVIEAGDIIHADDDGIVRIPKSIAAEVATTASAAIQSENKVRTAILAGVDPQEAYRQFGKF